MPRKGAKVTSNKAMEQPFKFIAEGLSVSDRDEVWEEQPVEIQEFIESPKFCNQKFDGRRGCRPKIMEIAKRLCDPKVREAILLLGKGSGKDYISSLILLYHIYRCLCMRSPQKYHYLAPGSSLYFVNVARNENQAKNVFFAEFIGHLENCRWFQGRYEDPGSQRVNFDKNIYALSGNSQAFGWLGYNTIFWVGDEIAFFLSKDNADEEEDGVSKAEECWLAAYGSCQTRFPEHYKMIGITTPRFDDDFVMKKFYELTERMKEEGDAFTRQAATWDIHPTLTKEDFRHEFQRDARRTMRDFGAQPVGVIDTFWGDPDFLMKNVCSECKQCPVYQACFDKEGHLIATDPYMCWDYDDCKADGYKGNGEFRDWLIADPDTNYYLHFDLSKNKDKTGFAMTHVVDFIQVEMDMSEKLAKRKENAAKGHGEVDPYFDEQDYVTERALMKTDFVAWINPKSTRDPKLTKSGEIYYDGIVNHIIVQLLDKGFNIAKVTMDQFQSHYFKQTLEDLGIECELLSLDRTDEVPVDAKNAIVDNRVSYPWNYILCREARHLKYINGRKVDHPTGHGKDIIDGFFGSIYNADNEDNSAGLFFDVEHANYYDD